MEAAEEAHAQRLYRIVTENTPTAGTPIIGRLADSSAPSAGSGRRSRQRSSRGGSSSTTPDAANPTDTSPPLTPPDIRYNIHGYRYKGWGGSNGHGIAPHYILIATLLESRWDVPSVQWSSNNFLLGNIFFYSSCVSST